jgi:outer membrane protein
MNKLPLISMLALAALAGTAAPAMAQQSQTEGNWLVRVRALSLEPDNKFDAKQVLADDSVNVSDKWIPEVDISYFFTKNIAAELVLTVPQRHNVSVDGVGKIGTFKHLPPSLLLQYHFNPEGSFRPYVGAGINYTILGSEKMRALGGDVTLENDSFGGVLQLGFDYKIDKNLFLNFDVKKIQLRTDVTHSVVGNLGTLKVDPLLWGVGIGYRF